MSLETVAQIEVDRLQFELARFDLGEVQNVVDDASAAQSAEASTVVRYSRCSGVSSVSSSSSVMPMTPFIGVRISWLMLARNSLLARLADSAASLAFCSSTSVCLRSATSRRSSAVRS